MIKNVSFDTKEYKHGISLWVIIEHGGIKTRKLLGSTFKDKEEIHTYLLDMIKEGFNHIYNK